MTQLPGILAEIEAATDRCTALKLAARFGGQRIKIPARPRETSPIAQCVGLEPARAIVDAIGHGEIAIPMAHLRGAGGRRSAVAKAIREGKSVATAARIADVHERTAWRVKSAMADNSLPLFDRAIDSGTDSGDL